MEKSGVETYLKTIEMTNENLDLYLEDISDIHHQMFPKNHLTANFSQEKTKEYYYNIIKASDLSIALIQVSSPKEKDDIVLGYIVAGESVPLGVANFLKKNRLYVFAIMIKKPSLFISKLKAMISSKVKGSFSSKVKFRLLSIAISDKAKSKGIGTILLNSFEEILETRGIQNYGLSVKSSNSKAITFYEKNNFKLESKFKDANYYQKKLFD